MSVDWGPALGIGMFAGLVGGVVLLVRALKRDLDDVGDMRSVARAHAAVAREGAVVRVVGRVVDHGGEMLVAPVSGRRCVAYEFELRYGNGERILGDHASIPFMLDDGGTRAGTSSACRILALRPRVDERSRPEDVPASFAAWLEDNHASDEWRHERELQWWESRIELGDTVAVVGVARREIAQEGEGGYRDAPTLLMLDDADDAPLSLGDDPSLLI